MIVEPTAIDGVRIIRPDVYRDERGEFFESWNRRRYDESGVGDEFVQDNVSRSARGVLRGLHLQCPNDQVKLVSVQYGSIYDVAVDVRAGSPTFAKSVGVTLTHENHAQLLIPAGFAHGFCVTSEIAIVSYKCTDFYVPASELGVRWDDPDLAIAWPTSQPRLSPKDAAYPRLRDIPGARLPLHQR